MFITFLRMQQNHVEEFFSVPLVVPVRTDPTFERLRIFEKIKIRGLRDTFGKSDLVRAGEQGDPRRSRIPSEPAPRDSRETGGVRGDSGEESRKRKDSNRART